MANIGYIRVSTVGQNTNRQLSGLALDKIFKDKISGKSIKRPGLQKCLEYIREGDTLHIHSMDRLARNLADLQNTVEDLTGKGISVKFHKENLTFTNDANAMSKLLLQVMGAVAEFERALIKERQMEGLAAAKAKGKILGRAPALNDEQIQEARAMALVKTPKAQIAKHFGISRQTLYKYLAKTE